MIRGQAQQPEATDMVVLAGGNAAEQNRGCNSCALQGPRLLARCNSEKLTALRSDSRKGFSAVMFFKIYQRDLIVFHRLETEAVLVWAPKSSLRLI